MNLINELVGEIDNLCLIIFITVLNISLSMTAIWILLSDRNTREDARRRIAECEEAIMLIKEYAKETEKDSSSNGLKVDELSKSVEIMKKEIEKTKQSLARFARPLEKDTEYKTVTVVNAKLK